MAERHALFQMQGASFVQRRQTASDFAFVLPNPVLPKTVSKVINNYFH